MADKNLDNTIIILKTIEDAQCYWYSRSHGNVLRCLKLAKIKLDDLIEGMEAHGD